MSRAQQELSRDRRLITPDPTDTQNALSVSLVWICTTDPTRRSVANTKLVSRVSLTTLSLCFEATTRSIRPT